jgi:hypothetical protein
MATPLEIAPLAISIEAPGFGAHRATHDLLTRGCLRANDQIRRPNFLSPGRPLQFEVSWTTDSPWHAPGLDVF